MDVIYTIWIVTATVFIYMIPTFVAWQRGVQNTKSVAVINVFLGWSLVGWVVALAMAVRDVKPAPSA